MEITNTALIVVGCIAGILLIAVLVILLLRFYKQWIGRKNPTYQLLRREDEETKTPPSTRSFQPKFTASFPTSALPTQFIEKRIDYNLLDKDEDKRNKERLKQPNQLQQQQQQQQRKKVLERTSGIKRYEKSRRGLTRKGFSDSHITVLQSDDNSEKHLTKRDLEMGPLGTPRRARASSSLQVVPEMSGQIEYSVLLSSEKRFLEINLIQIIEMNEISPEMFKDNFPIFDVGEVPSGERTPHLLRRRNKQVTFSDPDQLGFCVEVMKFPKKEHLCTTDYKYGMQNTSINEIYTSEFTDSEQLKNSIIRLQILLRYGRQPQRPNIVGEVVLPLRKCTDGVSNLFRDELKFPIDEIELESIAMEYACIGKMVVSVRYQLLHRHLTVRICEAIYNNRIGNQSPSTSVKVGVYVGEFCVFKETTEVMKRTLNPQFGKSFDFKLEHEKLKNSAILLEVQQHGYFQKTIVGYVHIGLKASKRGRNYWREVIGFSDFNTECILDIQTEKPAKLC